VVAVGVDATKALVLSQVVLSVALPAPMISLILFTGRADVMGGFANSRPTQILAAVAAGVVLSLNIFLIAQALGSPLFGGVS